MGITTRKDSKAHLQIRFEIAGVKVRRTAGTSSIKAAKRLEEKLRADLRKQLESGRVRHTWEEAIAKFEQEKGQQASWATRTKTDIDVLSEYWSESWIDEIDYNRILETRELLKLRPCKGHNWKTVRTWKPSTVNRVLAVASSILNRCASKDWADLGKEPGHRVKWIEEAPTIPLLDVPQFEPPNVNRAKVCELFDAFPLHTADMSVVALSTGLRRANVTGLRRSRIDLQRVDEDGNPAPCCFVPGYETKNGEPITIPLGADAVAVLERWEAIHAQRDHEWPEEVRDFVFVYRRRTIKQITTRMWRRECRAVGLAGFTFHMLRHVWASWQVHSGTTSRILQWMGGWKSEAMPQRYTHLDPGILRQFANRTQLPRQPVTDRSGKGASKRRPAVTDGPPVTKTVTVPETQQRARVSPCFGADSRNRTVDPIITKTTVTRKAG